MSKTKKKRQRRRIYYIRQAIKALSVSQKSYLRALFQLRSFEKEEDDSFLLRENQEEHENGEDWNV